MAPPQTEVVDLWTSNCSLRGETGEFQLPTGAIKNWKWRVKVGIGTARTHHTNVEIHKRQTGDD